MKSAVDFIFIVKQRLVTSKFNEFAKILSDLCSKKSFNGFDDDLISKLKNIFDDEDHEDLLFGLNQFLPRNHETCTLQKDDDPPKKKSCKRKYSWLLTKSPSEFFDKIRDRCIEKNDDDFSVLMKFSELIVLYHDKKITASQVDFVCRDLFKDDPDLYVESTSVIGQSLKKEYGSGLECSDKRRKTVKHKWTLYDRIVSAKESYLYEMDMSFSRIESTIKKLEMEDPERFEENFTVHDLKCIVELYKDSDSGFGEEVVEILQCDPVGRIVARVVVLERLRQKKIQLEEQKLRLNKAWEEIFEDVRKKGVVCRHLEFFEKMKGISKDNYGDTDSNSD